MYCNKLADDILLGDLVFPLTPTVGVSMDTVVLALLALLKQLVVGLCFNQSNNRDKGPRVSTHGPDESGLAS